MGSSHRRLLPGVTEPTAPKEPHAVYVYCVVRGSSAPSLAQPDPPLPGASAPRVLPLGARAWMVVADVPLRIYGAGTIEAQLRDIDWVGACGVAHQAIVDACMRSVDAVVPMKVFTIFKTIERARAEMRRRGLQLNALMRQVAGCVEWGVRVTRAPQASREPEGRLRQEQKAAAAPARAQAQAQVKPSGTAFLTARLQERVTVREAAAALGQHIRELADTLTGVTRDVRYRLDPSHASLPVPVLLDAAYLVPRQAESRFRLQVKLKSRPLLARGCRVTVTGPWPAYSFVSPPGR